MSSNNNNNIRKNPRTSRTSIQNSAEIRRNLTHKHNQLKVEIRKSKRNEQISKKRFGGGNNDSSSNRIQIQQQLHQQNNLSNSSSSKEELIGLSLGLINDLHDDGSNDNNNIIHSTQESFSKSDGNTINGLLRLEAEDVPLSDTLSIRLCNALVKCLLSNNSKIENKIEACRVITNLAAAEASSSSSSTNGDTSTGDDYYYGSCWRPYEIGWCGVLINCNAIDALISTMQLFTESKQSHASVIALCQQSCWAISNIAADCQSSSSSSNVISQAIEPLMSTLCVAYSQATERNGPEIERLHSTLSSLCQHASWALSNIAKNSAVPAASFLSNPDKGIELIVKLLLPHEQFHCLLPTTASSNLQQIQQNYAGITTNWLQVTLEISTLLASLTSKEDSAVDIIATSCNSNSYNSSLFTILAYRVASSIYAILNFKDATNISLFSKICTFSLRTIGNIATACDGKFIQSLMTAPTTTPHITSPSIIQSLSQIMDITASSPHNTTYTSLSINACWVASTFLYDAGISPQHPSTLSCNVLLPSLCHIVTSTQNTNRDLKRESLLAIHNAISLYPHSPTIKYDFLLRQQIIVSIINTNSTPLFISSILNLLTKYYDVECLHVSLKVLNNILRTFTSSDNDTDLLQSIKRIILENDGLHILESICDEFTSGGGSNSTNMETAHTVEECADIAANLIDDFFEEEY